MRKRFFFLLCGLAASLCTLHAGVEEDWAVIISLDAGPQKKPQTREEAQMQMRAHLARQKKAIEDFLQKYPQDPRAFDAKLRLAGIWATEGNLDNNQAPVDKAMRLLADLEATPGVAFDNRANAGFLRVSLFMQSQKGDPARVRDAVVLAARNYAAKYPGDRRGPRLLVEAGTLCDETPQLKKSLLAEAQATTREEPLKRRIEDDLKRIDYVGKPLDLRLPAVQGGEINLAAYRGSVVILIFWASDSPHSLFWLRDFMAAAAKWPPGNLKIVTMGLDTDRPAFLERLKALPPSWPAAFDGKGWESPVARSLGINALPSVWILDKKGVVRSINAKSNYESWVRQLSRE